jgi:hypothetical protein
VEQASVKKCCAASGIVWNESLTLACELFRLSVYDLKLPAHVLFRKDLSLIHWKPRGLLDESTVNEIVAFIEAVEKRNRNPLSRFSDVSALDAVDLNFKFVFHVALGRRLSAARRPAVKSAFYVASAATMHYIKLHAMVTDYSPLRVALFTDRADAAKWLDVPIEALFE